MGLTERTAVTQTLIKEVRELSHEDICIPAVVVEQGVQLGQSTKIERNKTGEEEKRANHAQTYRFL